MNAQDLQLQTIVLQLQAQSLAFEDLKNELIRNQFYKEIPAFVTLQKAAELKGHKSAAGLYKRHWQQPCCGHEYQRLNGVRVWTREQIIEWLKVDDDHLENYAQAHNVNISKWFKDGKAVSGC